MTEKTKPDLAEIGRLAVAEYLANRAYTDYVHRMDLSTCHAEMPDIVRGRDLHAARLRAELEREDAIFDYLSDHQ